MTPSYPSEQFGREAAQLFSKYLTGLSFPLFSVFIIALIQGIRLGFSHNDFLFLILGSVVSLICSFLFILVPINEAYGKPRKAWAFLAVMCGNITYAFIVYITAYRGLWGLIHLFWDFSFYSLFASLVFTALGLLAIKPLGLMSEAAVRIGDLIDSSRKAEQGAAANP